ncbi:MAG TPA: glutamate mutase L [Anaerolineales bacterium]
MTTSLIDADSLLVVDVGSVSTRAMLFDVVDGRYRFLASGQAPTTAGAPFRDVGEGVRLAIDKLQSVTGRTLIGDDERLILKGAGGSSGVDAFAATISAGPPLKIMAAGLLEDVSLESICRLAATTYAGAVETMCLTGRRPADAQIDSILRLRPDLILLAGGTEGGASHSVLKLLDPIGLACYLMPEDQRPQVLFAGNQELDDEIRTSIGKVADVHFAANVRPALDVEQLDPAQTQLAAITSQVRVRQIPGVKELSEWASGNLMPTSAAFGRLIRFLSKASATNKGVLGVDVGASATTLAAAFDGELVMGVYPQLGLGNGLSHLLENVRLEEITRWLALDISDETVRDYLYNKALYPASLPATQEDLVIEQAITRQVLRSAVGRMNAGFPAGVSRSGAGLLPWFEPVVATGSVLTRAPGMAQTLLMLLDGLQPTGATTLVLDQSHLAAAMGVAAAVNPILVAQVLDSTTFLYLGTVISPVGNARPGTPVLRLKMTYETGHEAMVDVKQGSLEVLPLPLGQTARLHLQPLHRYDVGMGGAGRSGRLNVHGGALGVVIDARGRPLQLPEDAGRRRELFKKWLWTLGG